MRKMTCMNEEAGKFAGMFNRRHFSFSHGLVGHPLFRLSRLADLAVTVTSAGGGQWSPNHNVLFKIAETVPNSAKQWANFKEPDRIHDIVENIETSNAWILITGADVDPEYRSLLDDMLADGEAACSANYRGSVLWSTLSILVGSPNSVTHYHIDSESNFLFQIHGDKEAHLFDADDRSVLPVSDIEEFVVVGGDHIKFDPEYEKRGTVYNLHAGDGVHIPPFAGHWVRNLSKYSITATALFYTREATETAWVHQCNYVLRRCGFAPSPPGTKPIADRMKAGLIGALSKRRPADKYEVLKSGVRRLMAPSRFLPQSH